MVLGDGFMYLGHLAEYLNGSSKAFDINLAITGGINHISERYIPSAENKVVITQPISAPTISKNGKRYDAARIVQDKPPVVSAGAVPKSKAIVGNKAVSKNKSNMKPSATSSILLAQTAKSKSERETNMSKKWWWVIGGVLIVVGAGVGIYFVTRRRSSLAGLGEYRGSYGGTRLLGLGAASGRPLWKIAEEIRRDWKNVYFGAVPYLEALTDLESIQDKYGYDDGTSIVAYFLSNAQSWRGETARRVKAELSAMLKSAYGRRR